MSTPAPGSPEWLRLVTASKVAAIIGVSPWESPRSMWHRMRGELPSVEVSDAMQRGHYLEDGILAWWRDRHPEYTRCTPQHYATRPDLPWAAATPDLRAETEGGEVVLVDAKSTSQTDEWGQPGTDEVPTHYLTSSYWQLAVSPAAERVYLAVLGPFLRFEEYVIERDEEIQADLIERCRRFYDSLSADTPPDLDDSVATFESLRAINGPIAKGQTAVLDVDLAREWLAARDAEAAAVAEATALDSRVIEAAGPAQYLTALGVRIGRQQSNRKRPITLATAHALSLENIA